MKAVLICFDFPGNHPWPIHFQQSCSVECFTENGFNYQCLSVSFSKDPEQLNWEHMWAVELWTWANNYYLLTFQIRGNSILIHSRGTIMCVLICVFHTFFYFTWQINRELRKDNSNYKVNCKQFKQKFRIPKFLQTLDIKPGWLLH